MKSSHPELYKGVCLINFQIPQSYYSRNSKSTMPQEQCPGREETRYNDLEEVSFQFDDLPPQLENELEYTWGRDDSGNGDDIDNDAPPVLMPNYPRLSFNNILSWFSIVETAFRDLNITDYSNCLEILLDSLDADVYALIEDVLNSAQFARTGNRYPLLKRTILLRYYANHPVLT